MKLDFRKAPSFSAYDEGTIYFETSTHAIKVGTGNNAFEMYSGVRSAKFDSSTKVLTVVNEEGVDIVLNFADVASASGINSLLSTLRDDINKKLDKPTVAGTAGQVLRLKSDGNTEWYSIPAATDYSVTITSSTPEGVAKRYTITQLGSTVGTIDIPKDLVVSSGSVVAGTWAGNSFTESASGKDQAIKLVIANQTTPIYINVAKLVDIYTAKKNATQVQLAIDSATNEISASIVAGSITSTELDSATNNLLAKAGTAVQSIKEGSTNGTILVDGKSVAVHGLKSAAYKDSSDFATADQGAKADSAIQSVAGETAVANSSYVKVSVEASTQASTKAVTLSSHANVTTHDISTAVANTADGLAVASDVKSYVDSIKEWKQFD